MFYLVIVKECLQLFRSGTFQIGLTDWVLSLLPNKQCHSTEGKFLFPV